MSKAESCPIFGRKDSVPVRPSVPCFFSFFFFSTRPGLWNCCLIFSRWHGSFVLRVWRGNVAIVPPKPSGYTVSPFTYCRPSWLQGLAIARKGAKTDVQVYIRDTCFYILGRHWKGWLPVLQKANLVPQSSCPEWLQQWMVYRQCLLFLGFCPLQEACGRTMVFMSFFLIVHDKEHLFIFSFLYYSSPGLSRQSVSCGPVWLGNHSVAQVCFKHIIFLPIVPKCCDHRVVPSCLTYGMVLLKNYFKCFAYVFLCECMCVVYVYKCRCPWEASGIRSSWNQSCKWLWASW